MWQKYKKKDKKKTKEMKRKLLSINKIVRKRTQETKVEVRKITGQMADAAKVTLKKHSRC